MKEINGVKLYTAQELAELFGVSYVTMLKYIRQGNIVKTHIGRTTYISEKNVIDYLNGKTGSRQEAKEK